MRLLTKTTQEQQGESNKRSEPVSTSYNVSNQALTWLTIIYFVVQTAATTAANYINNKPQRDLEKNVFSLKEKNLQIQLLQRVLEGEKEEDRRASLKLLVKACLLEECEKGGISNLADSKSYIPQWPKRDLEPLNNYIGTGIAPNNPLNLSNTHRDTQRAVITTKPQGTGGTPGTDSTRG